MSEREKLEALVEQLRGENRKLRDELAAALRALLRLRHRRST